jgi:DNA-binding CsgD family transcriptional regulator
MPQFAEALTPRECEVLQLIAAGRTTKQIAADLGITFKTAACHRAHIMEKLDLHNVADLVRYAMGQEQHRLQMERQRLEQEYMAQLHDAEKAYRTAERHSKEVIEFTKARGWRPDADGQQALYIAQADERGALEKYIKALKVFTDLVLEGRHRRDHPNQEER